MKTASLFWLVCISLCQFSSVQLMESAWADEPARTWRDAAGKFSIEAKLIDVQADTVRLLKTSGDTIQVPLSKLSEKDREYIKNAASTKSASSSDSDNPFATPSPDKIAPVQATFSLQSVTPSQDVADLPAQGTTTLLPKSTDCEPLTVDPAASLPNLKAGLALIAQADAYDDVSDVVTLNPRQALVGVSLGRLVAGSNQPASGKLLVGQLPKGPFTLVSENAEANKLFDHHVQTGQTLLVSNLDILKRGGELVLLKGLAEGKPIELYRRRLPGIDKPGFKPQVTHARLINEDLAIVIVDSAIFCWNLKSSQLIYRTEDNALSLHRGVAYSGTGKWLAVPQQGGFSLIESATGEDRGFVETGSSLAPGLAFHSDGRRIGYCSGNSWGVWDIASAKKIVSGVVTEHLGDKLTGWVGNDLLLTDSGNLIDTKSEMLFWNYYWGVAESRLLWNNWLVLVAKDNGLKATTLPIPDQKAQMAIRKLDQQKNLMVTSPGTEVRVEIESTEAVDKKALTEALTTAIERAGWQIKPTAKLAVVAKIGRGKPYSLQYKSRPIGGAAGAEQVHNVEIKPFTAMLEIRSGKSVLWTRNTENFAPPMLFLEGNETVQQAVKKYERPQPEFFSSLQIPPRIPRSEIAKGLGSSRIEKGVWIDFPR